MSSSRILTLVMTSRKGLAVKGSWINPTEVGVRFISSRDGKSYHYGRDWRKEKGVTLEYGPLTDGPDYSFVDGRPTPPGSGKIKRAEKQLKLSKKIIELSKEMDFAKEYRKQRNTAEDERKSGILARKLKPKGKETDGD